MDNIYRYVREKIWLTLNEDGKFNNTNKITILVSPSLYYSLTQFPLFLYDHIDDNHIQCYIMIGEYKINFNLKSTLNDYTWEYEND